MFHEDTTVDIGYNKNVVEVDNTMYHVVHDNNLLKLNLYKISNYVLFPYHLSIVFVQIPC